MAGFWSQYWHVVAFYALVVIGLFAFRKKFEWQGKIVGLLKTGWGVEWMQRTGEKHATLIKRLGRVGVWVGFAGMVGIVAFLLYGVWQLFAQPDAAAILTPVLPGVSVPGSPITFPLFKTLIALFVVIVIHEAAHGLVAAAHGLKVKSSGLLVFGPIFGAFVEPDEEELTERPHNVQHSVFAAGPWANVLGAIAFLLLTFLFIQAAAPLAGASGFTFSNTINDSPARAAGLPANVTYVAVDGEPVEGTAALLGKLKETAPGDDVVFSTGEGDYTVTLGERDGESWVGIYGIDTVYELEQSAPWLFAVLAYLQGLFYWIFVLNLGLGTANLIPLGPVDGGRMLQLALHRWVGEEQGDRIWAKTSWALLLIVILLVVVPILRAVFGA